MDQREIEHQAEQAPWAGRNEVYLPHDPIQLAHFRKGPQPPKPDAYDNIAYCPAWWVVAAGLSIWAVLIWLGFWFLSK